MEKQCPLSRSAAEIQALSNIMHGYLVISEQCGRYFITEGLIRGLNSKQNLTNAHLNLAYETMKASDADIPLAWVNEGNSPVKWPNPRTIQKVFEEYAAAPIDHALKEENLLKMMAEKLYDHAPTDPVRFDKRDLILLKMRDFDEMAEWLWSLHTHEYISISIQKGQRVNDRNGWQNTLKNGDFVAVVTPKGWSKVSSLQSRSHTQMVFIAQAFEKAIKGQIRDAIKTSFNGTAIVAESVECEEFNGPIIDQIKVKVRKARCMIADLTLHRNGVYYEAGYAEGLGIPVIYTCRDTDIPNAHFDVKHLNLVVWENEAQLTERLKARFEALFGSLTK